MAVKEELFDKNETVGTSIQSIRFDNILSDPKHPVVLFSTVRHPLDRLVELMLHIQTV